MTIDSPGSWLPPPPAPAARNRRTPILIAVLALVVIAVGAAIGIAVSSGGDSDPLAGGAPSSTTAGSPVASGSTSASAAQGGKKGKQHATRGTITAESGSTWTIRTAQGNSVAVTVTARTKFGTKKAPATQTDFPVGKSVAVVSPGTGSTVTATRIRAVAATPHPSTSPTAS